MDNVEQFRQRGHVTYTAANQEQLNKDWAALTSISREAWRANARRQERRERLGFIAYSFALAATAFLSGWWAGQ
jgi:predicted O-linked N-acetylglucosamine transferase (SPINDLY family)